MSWVVSTRGLLASFVQRIPSALVARPIASKGLAIFLTIDRLLPDWRQRVFGSEVVELSPLLAEAIATD